MKLPLSVRVAIGAVIVAAITGILGSISYGIYRLGYNAADGKWQKKVADRDAAEKKAIVDRLTEIEQLQVAHELEKQKLRKGYDDEIARSRSLSAAAPRMRISAALCSGFTGEAQAAGTSRSDGGDSATRLVPERIEEDIRRLELTVEAIFAGCRVAQAHLKTHGMAP